MLLQQPTSPVIVKIVEPKEDSLYDVLFGALGLTGVMVVIAVLAALVFAGVLFWVRSSRGYTEETKVTPSTATPPTSRPEATSDTFESR